MTIVCLVPRMAGTLQILSHSLIPENPVGVASIFTIFQISKLKGFAQGYTTNK